MDKFLLKVKKYIPKNIWKYIWPVYHFLLAFAGNMFYRFPSNKLIVIGVTGTTGKTTSVYLIAAVLRNAGFKVGYTSTAMFSDGNKDWLNNKKMTMVGRFFMPRMLRRMVANGCQFAIVETSSEGIVQYRHRFINYDTVVFTGLYPEHIESHGGFENYKEAKGMLFAHLKDCKTKYADTNKKIKKVEAGLKKLSLDRVKKTIIVNGDDEYKDYFLKFWAEEKMEYHIVEKKALAEVASDYKPKSHNYHELFAGEVKIGPKGTDFSVVRPAAGKEQYEIELRLLGGFNVANAMNALSAALAHGLDLKQVKQALEKVKGIPGRLEMIDQGQPFTVLVDYAFEPRAVEKLYETVELLPHRKVIHILGSAGGGRDSARRPVLGRIAGENADIVIVTNEDPYDEDPEIIVDQVILGAEKAGKKQGQDLYKIMDRREAIAKAFSLAEADDLVLITGKGSEQAIVMAKGEKFQWDDRQVAREELKKLK